MNNNSILKQVPSYQTLRTNLKRIVFGGDGRPQCPQCESYQVKSITRAQRWRCRQCRHPFSIKSCCPFLKYSKLSLETIWLLVWCWQKKVPRQQTADICGVSAVTAYNWFAKFRNNIPKKRAETVLGEKTDTVACDELFMGEKAVIGAKAKGTRNVVLKVLNTEDPHKQHAVEFLTRFVATDTTVCTDGAGIYRGIEDYHRIEHEYERHNQFEFELTAEIEGVWANFRTFVRRMYHHVTTDKLPLIAREFALRFSQNRIFRSPRDYFTICLSERPFAL